MVSKRKLLGLVIAVILIIVLLVIFIPGITDLFPVDNPLLGDRYRFVRYYACSMAICLKGCGTNEVENLCIDKNWKGECEKYCGQVCHDDFGGNPGDKLCGPDYKINLGLRGNPKIKGVKITVGIGVPSGYTIESEMRNMMDTLYKKHTTGDAEFPINPETFMPSACFNLIGTNTKYYEYGSLIKEDDDSKWDDGRGAIVMYPTQAHPIFHCFGYGEPGGEFYPVGVSMTIWHGFIQCEFKGNLEMFTKKLPQYTDGCVDVVIWTKGTVDPEFYLDAESPKTIPKDTERPITLTLRNRLGWDDTFYINIGTISGGTAECHFGGGETTTKLSDVVDGTDVTTTVLCKPTSAGPITVEFTAADGGVTASAVSIIDTGYFLVDIVEGNYIIFADTGEKEVSDVNVVNQLGENADIDLTVDVNPNDGKLICTLDDNSLNLNHEETGTTKLRCEAFSGAESDPYTVTVTGSYDAGDTIITADDNIPIWVAQCTINSLTLLFDPPNVNSGDTVTMKAKGFQSCQGKTVYFYLQPGFELGSQYIPLGPSGDNAKLEIQTEGPGTYTINVSLDANGVNGLELGESETEDLIINPGEGFDSPPSQGSNCWFSHQTPFGCPTSNLCEQPQGLPWCSNGYPLCVADLDPQTDGGASYASICCKDGSDDLDSGPNDAPCLSTDVSRSAKTDDMYWNFVDTSRNLLLSDDIFATFKPFGGCGLFQDCGCGSPDDCNGGNSGPPEMQALSVDCVSSGILVNGKVYHVCEADGLPDSPRYQAWKFIRISETSRPVYGIKVKTYFECWTNCWANMEIYLHQANGNWIFAGTGSNSGSCSPPNCPISEIKTFNLRPDPVWSWENVDAMLITYYPSGMTGGGFFEPTTPNYWVDYIGLLTKDEVDNVPFCTDGIGAYNRIVDDGTTCYWGLECRSDNDDGWTICSNCNSKVIAPFEVDLDENEENDIGCTCDYTSTDRRCGEGYCEIIVNGERLCYNKVKCMYGGWQAEGIDKCTGAQVCTADGCVG